MTAVADGARLTVTTIATATAGSEWRATGAPGSHRGWADLQPF
jgi:hypothetical protein